MTVVDIHTISISKKPSCERLCSLKVKMKKAVKSKVASSQKIITYSALSKQITVSNFAIASLSQCTKLDSTEDSL